MTGDRFRRRPDVLWRRSLDAVVLLPAAGGAEVLTLAATGPAVWEHLADWTTLERLSAVLGESFKSDPAVVEADLVRLLAELERFGMLEFAADSGGHAPE